MTQEAQADLLPSITLNDLALAIFAIGHAINWHKAQGKSQFDRDYIEKYKALMKLLGGIVDACELPAEEDGEAADNGNDKIFLRWERAPSPSREAELRRAAMQLIALVRGEHPRFTINAACDEIEALITGSAPVQPAEYGWIEWRGNAQKPNLNNDDWVKVRLRGGGDVWNQVGRLAWNHCGFSSDIIAYRLDGTLKEKDHG